MTSFRLAPLVILFLAASSPALAPRNARAQTAALDITLVGNAGVILSDGTTSLLVDLPYQPGAFGYMIYDAESLAPPGDVVSVITHAHRDHFAPELFIAHPAWRIIGPPSAVQGLSAERVIRGDSVSEGAFEVVAIPTSHTTDHRSYRVRWQGRVLHFTGDTEDVSALLAGPEANVLFATPWFVCELVKPGRRWPAERTVLYHMRPDGSDRRCGPAEWLEQGTTFQLAAANGRRGPD